MTTDRGRIQITGFDPADAQTSATDVSSIAPSADESPSRLRRLIMRFRRNRLAVLGVVVVAGMSLAALFARPISIAGVPVQPFSLAPYDPTVRVALQGSSASIYDPPSLAHPMGTDGDGRDVFSRLLFGGRRSISIGFLVVVLTATVGLVYGAIAGYYGGRVDEVLMRLVDTIFAFPGLVLALVVVAVLGRGYWQLVLAFSLFGWAGYARLIRGEVLSIKQDEYVLAARALGARDRSIIFTHVVPNAIAPLIVQASLSVGTVVIGVAALGFLGLGFEQAPEWGTMLNNARETIISGPGGQTYWWATVYPGLAIFLFVMAMNLIGDGINDALDARDQPTARQGGGG